MANNKSLEGIRVGEVKYTETSRGVAIDAVVYLDDVKVGYLENRGDGGATSIFIEPGEARTTFKMRRDSYFGANNIEDTGLSDEIFADHLLDVHDFGKVLTDDEKMKFLGL